MCLRVASARPCMAAAGTHVSLHYPHVCLSVCLSAWLSLVGDYLTPGSRRVCVCVCVFYKQVIVSSEPAAGGRVSDGRLSCAGEGEQQGRGRRAAGAVVADCGGAGCLRRCPQSRIPGVKGTILPFWSKRSFCPF